MIKTHASAPTKAREAINAKAIRPGDVPLECGVEAAPEVVAAAAAADGDIVDIIDVVDVEVILAVLKVLGLGLAVVDDELEDDVDVSEVVVSFIVLVDFEDFAEPGSVLVLAAEEEVAAAVLLSSVPSGITAVTGTRATVIPLL